MNNLLTLKSDKRILEALKTAAVSKKTEEQINAQRVSFIYGSVDHGNVTKAQIKAILANI